MLRCQHLFTQVKKPGSLMRWIHHSCKVLVVGGGTGGCTMAAKLSKYFEEQPNSLIILEPSQTHYYQPLFTLIGGGQASYKSSKKPMKDVLPEEALWINDKLETVLPDENKVFTSHGDVINYEVLIMAMGLTLYWEKVPGLLYALADSESQVCSIYGPHTVTSVFNVIKKCKKGSAVFTFPNSPVKCPGAPQKIAYLAEDYWSRIKKNNYRRDIDVIYNTSLPVIFGVKKYADALWKVCEQRNIHVNLNTNLIEINSEKREATFQNLQDPEKTTTVQYSMLHVTPPMGPPDVLKKQYKIVDDKGFLSVNPETLQQVNYPNIFGIGDCTNTHNSKTMAAIASQSEVLYKNLINYLSGKNLLMKYDGYASCPLVTGRGKCILAEFDYKLQPKETFPVNQGKEIYIMYLFKKYMFPFIYWKLMLKGHWNGPERFRKIFSILKKKEQNACT